MAKRKSFEIAFVGLKPGIHEFTYEVDDKFFAEGSVADFSIGPKRSESMTASGRAPMVKMSRRIPPTPVAAP